VQKLCAHLGCKSREINEAIQELVDEDKIHVSLQQMFDSVRVIDNEAVHPGTINFRDNIALVTKLFRVVTMIVDEAITKPREHRELYEGLPPGKLNGIEDRAAKSKARRAKNAPED
jgi:Domain of unknown function (DUF4145)